MSRWSAAALHLHGGAALTAVTIEGEKLPMTSGDTLFDPGVTVGLRLALAARLGPWVGATAVSWPRAHTLSVGGTSLTGQLPQFEAWLGAGPTLDEETETFSDALTWVKRSLSCLEPPAIPPPPIATWSTHPSTWRGSIARMSAR